MPELIFYASCLNFNFVPEDISDKHYFNVWQFRTFNSGLSGAKCKIFSFFVIILQTQTSNHCINSQQTLLFALFAVALLLFAHCRGVESSGLTKSDLSKTSRPSHKKLPEVIKPQGKDSGE